MAPMNSPSPIGFMIAVALWVILLGHGFLGIMFPTEPGMYQDYRVSKGQKQYLGSPYKVDHGPVSSQRVRATVEIFAGLAAGASLPIVLGELRSPLSIFMRVAPLFAQFAACILIGNMVPAVFSLVNFPVLSFLTWFGSTDVGGFLGADKPFLVHGSFILPGCFLGAFALCIQITLWRFALRGAEAASVAASRRIRRR